MVDMLPTSYQKSVDPAEEKRLDKDSRVSFRAPGN